MSNGSPNSDIPTTLEGAVSSSNTSLSEKYSLAHSSNTDTSDPSSYSSQKQWSPFPMMVHGKIIKSFLPVEKFPSLSISSFYQNLFYGDEVFLFETNNENWARGYLIVHPLPSDFIAKSTDLEKLPDTKVSVVIVPLSHVHVIDELPMRSTFSPPSLDDFDNSDSSIPSIYELQQSKTKARNGELADETSNVKLKPPLPLVRLNSADLLDEMVPSLTQLASHIYSLYSVAEHSLFEKLINLFEELNNIRIRLSQNLFTRNEKDNAKKQISLLFNQIAKLLSSKGIDRFNSANRSSELKSDPSGYETISARDIHTGELYKYSNDDISKDPIPKLIAANQLNAALAPNFPVTNNLEEQLHPKKIIKFDKVTPSQILVDFKAVQGTNLLNPEGFLGMTCYMFLRSAKKRLTEAFAIHINSAEFSLEKISAALFRNIPGTEVDTGRIYLVAIITEEIQVSNEKLPNSLGKIRKGLAAGVADISRIFSRHSGHLESGQSHQFTIKLYGSYVNKTDNTTLDPLNMNFGWGEVTDRIIAGSNKGVAVNPRAEKLVVSIKEFKDDLANVTQDFGKNFKTPIQQIRTNFFDPLVQAYDRVYISPGKVNLTHNSTPFPGDLVSLQLVNDNPNSKVSISKGTNEKPGKLWNFTSIHSNEVIGETIKVTDIEDIGDNETLKLKLFVNHQFKAETDIIISSNGNIYEYGTNQLISFSRNGINIGSVELTTQYIGKTYNIDSSFKAVLNWKKLFSLPEGETRLIETLKTLNQATLQQSIKYFKSLLIELLQIFSAAFKLNLPNLISASFYSFIHLLDVVIARQEQYTYLFHEFVADHEDSFDLPSVGSELLSITAGYFQKVETEWKFVGRTLCRILPLLIKTSVITLNRSEVKAFKNSWNDLWKALVKFLQLKVESIIPDQLLILTYSDITLDHLDSVLTTTEKVDCAIGLIDAVGTRTLNPQTVDSNNKSKMKESNILVTKLLLIRRFLTYSVLHSRDDPQVVEKFFFHAINWAIETHDDGANDLEILRLANSILITSCNLAWTIVIEKNEDFYALPRNISRLLLKISQIFVKATQFARTNNLFEPKRSYNQLFPNTYPFIDLITDSIINDVVLVEILVELGVIFSFVTKIAKNIPSSSNGFISIIDSCSNDTLFNISDNFVKSFSKSDLLSIIQTNRLLIQSKFFPSTKWISLYALLIEAAISSSELINPIMIRDHIPSAERADNYDRALWSRYLKSVLAIGGSMPASICHLYEVPRRSAWKITGDVRGRCATVLNQSWDSLGWDSLKRDYVRFEVKKTSGYHGEFIEDGYGILEELAVFCLQRNTYCQVVGVKILWSIIIAELLVQESSEEPIPDKLVEVERGCLAGLDRFFKSKRYIPGLYEQRNFINRLKMVVRLDPEDESFNDVYRLIQSFSEFLDVQHDLSSVPSGEEFDDERTFHVLDIQRQLMRVSNSKQFIASLDDLYQGNLSKNNHVQAALCLELMASTYDWNTDDMLPVSFKPKFPSETSFSRKESLYKRIAEELIKGKRLEKAVLIYKELADAYDKINFNLLGLSFVHERLSDLYASLDTLDRETPTYYKVMFIGLGFPNTVRSRSFIYEGLPFEHINSIHNRLLRAHVGAKIIADDDEAVQASKNAPPGKFLHIVTVKPQTDFTSYQGDLSSAARLYMQNKDLKYFTTSRRLQKSTSVLDLWVEETTYETYNVFPTLMKRSEILHTTNIKLSPIQNALRTISSKTQDLVNAESASQKAFKTGSSGSSSFNALSRNLSGTVDSPVNGGIGQYREFLLKIPDPEDEEAQNEIALLKSAFDNLTICIYRCLFVHGNLVPNSLRESHLALVRLFEKNFTDEITRTGLDIFELENSLPSPSPISTPPLSKVPSISTVNTANSANTNRLSSFASVVTSPLHKSDTRSSDQRSISRNSQTTQATGESGNKSRLRFTMNWRSFKSDN